MYAELKLSNRIKKSKPVFGVISLKSFLLTVFSYTKPAPLTHRNWSYWLHLRITTRFSWSHSSFNWSPESASSQNTGIVIGLNLSEWVKVAKPCLTLWDPMGYSPWNSPGQNTGVGSLSLLQGIFPTQGSNPPDEPQEKQGLNLFVLVCLGIIRIVRQCLKITFFHLFK